MNIQRMLIFSTAVLLLLTQVRSEPTNVALNKGTRSSTGTKKEAAVDGVTTTSFIASSCGSCFMSEDGRDEWWRVALVQNYFLTSISLYTGKSSIEMNGFKILSTSEPGQIHPINNLDKWAIQYTSTSGLVSTVHHAVQPAVLARSVAVVKESGRIILTELEVYGYAMSDFKPTNIQISQVTSSCVTFKWDAPDGDNSILTVYKYKCDGNTSWTSVGNTRTATSCAATPSVGTECNVRVGTYKETLVSVKISCSDIEILEPTELRFNSPTLAMENGRQRWKYTVTWKKEDPYNCIHSTNPYRIQVDNTAAKDNTQGNYDLYIDGGVYVTVKVWQHNKNNVLSSAATRSTTTLTNNIPPQVAPRNFQVTAESPTCIKLKWDNVFYPNGQVSGITYQYKCMTNSWRDIPADKKVCSFTPNTEIECQIRAAKQNNNKNKYSEEAVNRVRTRCDNLLPPKNLAFGSRTLVDNSNRKRWKYSVTWQKEDPYSCIHSTNPYRIMIDNTAAINHNQRSYDLYTDGGVSVTIKVWQRNTYNTLSTSSVTQTITTSTVNIPPQTVPRDFQLVAASSYCVRLSWNLVQYPNGPEDEIVYQYKCQTGSWTDIPASKQVCGFTPNTLIECQISAVRWTNTNNKYSKAASDSVRTLCGDLLPPKSLAFGNPTLVTNSNRNMWRYSVTWQIEDPYNCIHSRNPYQLKIDNSAAINYNQRSYNLYRDGGVPVTVKVWQRNIYNTLSTSSVTQTITTSTVNIPPQTAPRAFQLIASSPYCVVLSWNPVQYPNGPVDEIVYQMSCGGESWVNIPSSKQVCGYVPYELVSCKIRARRGRNNVDRRNSKEAADSVRTLCADPQLPANLFPYISQDKYKPDGAEKRIKLTFSISDQAITSNCEKIKSKQYKVNEGDYKSSGVFIDNLPPYTNHSVTVKVTNNENMVKFATFFIVTLELEPYDAPVILRNVSHNESCVALSWKQPNQPNGVITKYQHKLYLNGMNPPDWEDYLPPKTENSLLSCGYKAGDLVVYKVRAKTVEFGPSAEGEIRVTCGFPSIPKIISTNDTHVKLGRKRIKLNITWEESDPACASIDYYNLTVMLDAKTIFHQGFNQTFDAENKENLGSLEDLDPYTNYSVILIAVNNANNQSSSAPHYIFTPELEPYNGPDLSVQFNTTCAFLTVKEPTEPNGVISHYEYGCANTGFEVIFNNNATTDEVQPHIVCGFSSVDKINCGVTAVNKAGNSPNKSETGYTLIEVTEFKVPELKKAKNSGSSLMITVYPIEVARGNIRSYLFLVKKNLEEKQRIKRSTQFPSECDLQSVIDTSPCHVTAEIDSSLVSNAGYELKLGDGENYGGHDNTPLEPNSNYKLYQGVKILTEEDTERVKYLDTPLEFFLDESCNRICIIAISVSLGVVLMTLLVIVIIFILRRKQGSPKSAAYEERKSMKLKDIKTSEPSSTASTNNPGRENRHKERATHRNDVYENFLLPSDSASITAISVHELENYVKRENHIKEEYKSFGNLTKPVMEVAALPENRGKCRYKGLYPADESRVKLDREGKSGTDFINASFIDEYSSEQPGYIAAQGPMKATLDDFWLMIWQHKPRAIVMVTNVLEGKQVKCVQYWPDDTRTKLKYGDLQVSMVSYEEWADFGVRVLKVEKNGEVRNVKQFHYISWPDHGVPDSMCPFTAFYKKVRYETSRVSSPLLVHCSAGVGRTGTFIALSNLLDQAKAEEKVDFYECVRKMRDNRPSMVQTADQYVFLHHVVEESLAAERFVCPPSDLLAKITDQEGGDNNIYANTATGRISAEFNRVETSVNNHTIDVEEAQKPENVKKNRDMSILPPSAPSDSDKSDQSLRPCISGPNGHYINAVFANAYRKQDQFIATQLPMANTLNDFLQMVEDHKVKVIVQLDMFNVNEHFYPYSGEKSSMKIGKFHIVRLTTDSNDEMSVITLKITSDSQAQDVIVIRADSWKKNHSFPSNSSMLDYMETLEKYQQMTGDGKICVTSLDGGMKCGSFICAHNAIEKLKAEQEVDLYSTVVMARLRRPQFVATLGLYESLYDLLREFTDKFSEYSNFQ